MNIDDLKEQMRAEAERLYHDSLRSIDDTVNAKWEQCRMELVIIDDSEEAMIASVHANFDRQRSAVMRRHGLTTAPQVPTVPQVPNE